MGNIETNLPYKVDETSDENHEIDYWMVKKCTFNGYYNNATLFIHNSNKVKPKIEYNYVSNQIKALKTIRHPSIVKYFYSFENRQNNEAVLITESVLPLNFLINELTCEQIISGFYNVTCAIQFLHNKAFVSHNNICDKNLYINTKMQWKLSGFEFCLNFNQINKENLLKIKSYKLNSRSNLTPEEECENFNYLTNKSDTYYHVIDVYCWAIMFNDLLNNQKILLNELDYKYLNLYLDSEPIKRPKIDTALELSLFKPSKLFSQTDQSQSKELQQDQKELLNEQLNMINEFNLENIIPKTPSIDQNDIIIDDYIRKLISYLESLISKLDQQPSMHDYLLNENLINFLLQPIMFFSLKIRKYVLPCILTPINSAKQTFNRENDAQNEHEFNLKPFINENKYTAYVLPRILNLFFMRILTIRLIILDYFPCFVYLIKNNDTLKYEILPELLIGLKDDNDELASKTFLCLSIMVKLLGSKVVIGSSSLKNGNQKFKYFSNNLPKFVPNDDKKLTHFKKYDNSVLNSKFNKVTSESMIALHEFHLNDSEAETDNTKKTETELKLMANKDDERTIASVTKSVTQILAAEDIVESKNGIKSDDEAEDDNEWSNDFNWNVVQDNNHKNETVLEETIQNKKPSVQSKEIENELIKSKERLLSYQSKINNDDLGSQYDIKNIKLNIKVSNDLDDFFNDMQPKIEATKKHFVDFDKNSNETLKINGSLNIASTATTTTTTAWDTDDIEIESDSEKN